MVKGMLMNFNFFTMLDSLWCSNTQLSASLLFKLTSDQYISHRLALFRIMSGLCVFLELFGLFLMTLGFFPKEPLTILMLGVIFKIIGGLGSSYFQNCSGVLLSLELQNSLKYLKTSGREIKAFLTHQGCTEIEIESISTLPSEIYQSELNSYQRALWINLGTPIVCSIPLLLHGEALIAFLLIFLGLISFPIGEKFFKENAFRNESEMRLGRSAHLLSYIKQVYKEHIALTLKVNSLSQISLLLFVFRFMWDGSGIIASFFGINQGLIGLTGTLAFQRSRMTSLRTIETAKHLISSITNSELIITPKRLEEHSSKSEHQALSEKLIQQVQNGVIFQDFCAQIPSKTDFIKTLPPLSCVIGSGEVAILQAPSGQGKSTFLLATMHLIEHSGELYFINNANVENIHSLSRETLEKRIFFFREETVEKSSRLIDLFKIIISLKLSNYIIEKKKEFGEVLVDLAWFASDNLMEQEVKKIEKSLPSIFPKNMLEFIKEMRDHRSCILQDMLKFSGGNISLPNIYPERIFETLSAGEKRRIITTLAYESAKSMNDIKLIILDEPLTHLDTVSIADQLTILKQIQELPSPPAILMISHHFIQETMSQLKNCAQIYHNISS